MIIPCPHDEAKEAKRYYVKDDYGTSHEQLCEACYKLSGMRAYMMGQGGPDTYTWWLGPSDY